ncbi:MAG: transposase, partial [Actinomycetota bacterium]|nr:transposase [Actinomycetota bacterium]
MVMADKRTALGYQDHYLVDGGKARIILHALVTPADVMENQPFLDQLRRVCFRWKLRPQRAIADTTYGTIENIRTLEEAGIQAFLPLADRDEATPYFGASKFRYEAERDVYVCPRGAELRRARVEYTAEKIEYRAAPEDCNTCPLKAHCTPSDRGRQLHRSFHAAHLERVRGYHETADFRKAMRKRKVWVEPLFGEAKQWHGLERFRLRGLAKVNMEGLLIAAGQNLKRWLAATGWGRRHFPGGAALGLALHLSVGGTRLRHRLVLRRPSSPPRTPVHTSPAGTGALFQQAGSFSRRAWGSGPRENHAWRAGASAQYLGLEGRAACGHRERMGQRRA